MRTPAIGLALIGLATGLSACSEQYNGGEACPVLCPTTSIAFRDTIIDAVSLDSAVRGYPEFGLSPRLLLANRPDTLVTRVVVRFDVVPTTYLPNRGSVSEPITLVDSVFLIVPFDTTGALGTGTVVISAYNVDTLQSDSSQVVVKSLFRPDRLIGSVTVTPNTVGDSLRIPLSKTFLQSQIAGGKRLRVGLQMTGGVGQLRIVSFVFGAGAPLVRFDPTTDTLYTPQIISPSTSLDGATSDVNLAYTVYGLTDKGSPVPDNTTLVVGGYPAYRTYLRFNLPRSISDSSTIVRAEVLLTQRPSTYANVTVPVALLPLVPTTSDLVTDVRRILDLSADGLFASLDSTLLVPGASGPRVINILRLARNWATLPANVPRAIAFRIGLEGAQPAELKFYSSEAAAPLRPRIRITYLPRTQNAIP